jgi:hypothetical protein
VQIWGEFTLRGSNPLRGSIAFLIHCIYVVMLCLNSKNAMLVLISLD